MDDPPIDDYPNIYRSKEMFYSLTLANSSQLFENIQNHLQTDLKSLISLD